MNYLHAMYRKSCIDGCVAFVKGLLWQCTNIFSSVLWCLIFEWGSFVNSGDLIFFLLNQVMDRNHWRPPKHQPPPSSMLSDSDITPSFLSAWPKYCEGGNNPILQGAEDQMMIKSADSKRGLMINCKYTHLTVSEMTLLICRIDWKLSVSKSTFRV